MSDGIKPFRSTSLAYSLRPPAQRHPAGAVEAQRLRSVGGGGPYRWGAAGLLAVGEELVEHHAEAPHVRRHGELTVGQGLWGVPDGTHTHTHTDRMRGRKSFAAFL